jgi:crotonobetainyl-CoA:carnitine CoA-transferase CaiB-like acyl-CoA transferase
MSATPLTGLKVLELSHTVMGPTAGLVLAELGADVVKIEPAPAGDHTRGLGGFAAGFFAAFNRNKRSLALDLKHPDGKTVLQRLIPTADVLVTNVRPAAMARLGFGYDACAKLNPRLIYAAATGFGQDGPWAARPAFDEIIQAASGLASSIGAEEEPKFVPSLIGDKICAQAMVGAVSAALFRRERSGKGQMVEVPMLETIAAFNSIEMLGGYAFDPPIGPTGYKRMKERRPVQTKDGWLTMLPYSGDNWCAFFEAVGRPELIEELAVKDPVARAHNIDRIYARMSEIGPTRTTAEWETLLLRLDVPHTAFARLSEIGEQPHLKAVGMFAEIDHPTEGRIKQARPPTRFSDDPPNMHRMSPRLGEHSHEVLRELGFSDAEIRALVESNAVGLAS